MSALSNGGTFSHRYLHSRCVRRGWCRPPSSSRWDRPSTAGLRAPSSSDTTPSSRCSRRCCGRTPARSHHDERFTSDSTTTTSIVVATTFTRWPGFTSTTTVWRPFLRDHPGEPVPDENFWTLWCKRRLTEADTPIIWLGATPSGLTSVHLHHLPHFLEARCPSCRPTASKHWRQLAHLD